MATQTQRFRFLAKQTLTSAGTPQQISSTKLLVTSFVFRNPAAVNGDQIYIADTSANALAGVNSDVIVGQGRFCAEVDRWGALNAFFDLSLFWWDGDNDSQNLIVYYQSETELD